MKHKSDLFIKGYFVGILLLVVILFVSVFPFNGHHYMNVESSQDFESHNHESMESLRENMISLKNSIHGNLLDNGGYKCCLEKPCTYCIEKTPGHGDGATCSCIKDVISGKHPCMECIGGILEGHGNPYLSEYFAEAISEKTGEKEAIMRIIEEKYGIAIGDQV